MPQGDKWYRFRDLRGGRNGGDPSIAIPDDQVLEAFNIDYEEAMVARKRGGSTSLSLGFSSGGPFSQGIKRLFRHVPGFDQTAAELWGIDGAHVIGRMAGASTFAAVTPKDPFTANDTDVQAVSFNGKLFFFGKTGVNRSQVWDGTSLRRMGLAPPTLPPTLVESAGAVTDNRKYKTTVIKKTGSTIDLRSELCENPSAQATLVTERATVSLDGDPGEGETHWELWGASDDDNYTTYHYISEAAIGNTIEDNNAVLTGDIPPTPGRNLVPPAARFAVADESRIVMAGGQETTSSYGQVPPKNNRIWWTPPLGDADIGDDERIIISSLSTPPIRAYIDVEGALTGFGGPVAGSLWATSYDRIWRMSPTGDATRPYRRLSQGTPYGCIHANSFCLGEDEKGEAALYFATVIGMYRIDSEGIVYCGWDLQDLWKTINLNATVPVHCVYHALKHQLWVHLATGSDSFPTIRLVFHTRFGQRHAVKGIIKGWARHEGSSCQATCSVMFSNTVGASMSRDLKPYVGLSSGTAVLKCDTDDLTDNGSNMQAYFDKVIAPPIQASFQLGPSDLLANAAAGVTIRQTITPDYGNQQAKVSDVDITPDGTETKVFREFEDGAIAGIDRVATVRVGDQAAVANRWTIDEYQIAVDQEQPH